MKLGRIGKDAIKNAINYADKPSFLQRFGKTSISDLSYVDNSKYFIGHSGSTYWHKKDSEKAEPNINGRRYSDIIQFWITNSLSITIYYHAILTKFKRWLGEITVRKNKCMFINYAK